MKDSGLYFRCLRYYFIFPSNLLSLCFTKATKNLSVPTQKLRSIAQKVLLVFEILLKNSKFLITNQSYNWETLFHMEHQDLSIYEQVLDQVWFVLSNLVIW